MRAIPTIYRGNRYRSRLEARWAAFFDVIGWSYTYEPFDADGYIPDFVIHGDSPLLIEVKPAVTRADYFAAIPKLEAGVSNHWKHDYLILGASPVAKLPNSFTSDYPAACVLGELHQADDGDISEWSPGIGLWFECSECLQLNIFHDSLCYRGRPCGHYDGDHFLGHVRRGSQGLEDVWSTAGRLTQWKASQLNIETHITEMETT